MNTPNKLTVPRVALLTPDFQIVRGAQRHTVALIPANRKDIETAVVMGFRLQLLF